MFSGTLFTVAFVWMAISSYDVDKEVIRVFLIMSFLWVGGLIILGFFFAFLIHFFKPRKDGLLAKIENRQKKKTQ